MDDITVVLARESDEDDFIVIPSSDWRMVTAQLRSCGEGDVLTHVRTWALEIEREHGDRLTSH